MVITATLKNQSYDIVIEKNLLKNAGKYLNLNRKVLIVTDSGVPKEYAEAVASQAGESVCVTVEQGEGSKSIGRLEQLLTVMLEHGFTRSDAVIAVGGGVVGDLCGFAAATYMRGIDFYNIPTTLLSQLDSSVGGKTAINMAGVKNCVGAFYQPRMVLIDPTVLDTLPKRQLASGLAEAAKMAATSNPELFELLESCEIKENIEKIIAESVKIKKSIVELDEREGGPRRILNFGHTVGHAIESATKMAFTHGECVAMGMLPMCGEHVRSRVKALLTRLELPTDIPCTADEIIGLIAHDKKLSGDCINAVYVNEIGDSEIVKMPLTEFEKKIRENLQ